MNAAPVDDGRLDLAVVIKRFVSTGGAERYAVETARGLLARGHRVTVYAREIDGGAAAGMAAQPVPDRWGFSSVVHSLAFARDAARLLAGRPHDAVVSHERGFLQDVAVVHTFSYRTGLARLGRLRRLDRHWLSPRSWLHLYLEARQMDSPVLVAVSEPIRREIARHYNRRRRVHVVTPGVDPARFDPRVLEAARAGRRRALGLDDDDLLVLFVGTEFRRKGLDDLMPAIGADMHLAVVGGGERPGHYHRLVRRLGLDGRVHFAGLVDDVSAWYAAADAVALPSRADAFGMSVLEGMACGRAVVARRSAGVAAVIEHARDGLVYDRPEELAGVLEALRDPALRLRLGRAARDTAVAHTWAAAAGALERLCHEVASARREIR